MRENYERDYEGYMCEIIESIEKEKYVREKNKFFFKREIYL